MYILSIYAMLLKVAIAEDFDNITDLTKCKLTHLGLEYSGDIAKTESWVRCQSWTSNEPHAVQESIVDNLFPELSRKKAKNYCRNPTNDPGGPWCYSMNTDLKFETCGIPLCSIQECKLTGPGMEYAGKHNKGVSDRKCLKWNKNRPKVKEGNKYTSYDKFSNKHFPEQDISKARKYCRNPNGDIGGPWCFVENEETDEIEKEYCDISFCQDFQCQVFTRDSQQYTHYTDFNSTLTQFNFGAKLWDSDSYLNATARLIISLLPLPLSGKQIGDAGIALEISISNKGSTLTFGNKDRPEYEETVGILKSTEFTMFTLSWTAPFISLGLQDAIKPIFLAEYRTKKNLLGFKKNVFHFYSVQGSNIIWTFPFCMDDFECDVHTTTGDQHQQFWRLRENEVGQELQFHLRTFHSASLLFVPCPTVNYPNIKFVLQRDNKMTRVTASFDKVSTIIIREMELPELLDYWSWHEFSVSFFADSMQFYWTKSVGTHLIFEIKHELFRGMRWFSPASGTVAHWTFFCMPPEISKAPAALLPECALNKDEKNYKGTQHVTSSGKLCLPWSSIKLLPTEAETMFAENGALEAWNYCRDPSKKRDGTFCYTIDTDGTIRKNFCQIRACKSENCRMAGTGNDYIGKLSTTRSNRTCDGWFENVTVHQVAGMYLNASLYADLSLFDTKNYCRNPARDVGGSWCYTNDPDVAKDLCNVRDCDRPEENIIIVTKSHIGRKVYVLPHWKIEGLEFGLKQWNPDFADGIHFEITPLRGTDKIELVVGAKNNEKVQLYRKGELKLEKTFLHLLSSGKWTDFWLVMRKGLTALGFKGIPNSFFEYESEDIFDPMFVSYGSINGHPIGFFFQSDQCQTEQTFTSAFTKILPIGLWSTEEKTVHSEFSLLIRGEGIVVIRLMALPTIGVPHTLKIDSLKNEISLQFHNKILVKQSYKTPILFTTNWTSLSLFFSERVLNISKENETILTFSSEIPLLFYWISLAVEKGLFTWSVNCEPLDIDGPPRDGGWSSWSPWRCTVACGGGEGFRTRNCSNPKPNIMGKLCPGSHKSTGVCNDFVCGDLSPATLEKIRDNLQTQQFSFVVNEGRSVILQNDEHILKIVSKESPDAYFEWTLNGIYLHEEPNKIIFRENNLVIRDAEVADSGIYVCMLYRINKQRVVLRAIAVAVVSLDYDIKTRATRSLVIPCNSVVLAYIYSSLSLKLVLNGNVYKDFGVTMLAAVDSEHFDSLNTSHSGDWKCVVEQKDLKLAWVTNYLRVEVKKAPNFYTNLMEDEFTKPYFAWLQTESNVFYALIVIVVFVIILVLLFVFIYFRCCTVKSRWQ